jgi:hypothetical protein
MKTRCQYCQGHTLDDMRGNCGACGAPRGIEPRKSVSFNSFTTQELLDDCIVSLREDTSPSLYDAVSSDWIGSAYSSAIWRAMQRLPIAIRAEITPLTD